jgi:TolB-like protein/Tfp pilus assembly protein PilF
MPSISNRLSQFWQELKRRNVVRVVTVYAGASFVIIELINNIYEPLRLPEWTPTLVIVLLAIGFPIVIIFSWIYDVHSEGGIVKTEAAEIIKAEEITKSSNRWKIASYISFMVILGLIAFNIFGGKKSYRKDESGVKSVAVLPFANISDDIEFNHLGDMMTEELIMQLYKINAFEVRSRTSVLQYKDTKKTIPLIGQELKVNYLLEGTTLRFEDQVRISVKLIESSTDNQIWGEVYEGQWKNIFNIQIEVAKQVATELKAVLSPAEIKTIEKISTANSEAYDLYLKGRWFWNKWTDEDIKKGIKYFQQAIDEDPNYALAHAGLAEAYNTLSFYGQMYPADAFPKAKELAERALELDPELAEAHIALAFVKTYYEWDWKGGEESFKRAISLDPNNVTAHHLYAYYLIIQTRFEEALQEIQKALSLDPLNLITNRTLGDFYYHMRDYENAEAKLLHTLEMNPGFTFTHAYLGLVYLQKGNCERALIELQNEIKLAIGTEDLALAWMGYAYGVCGNRQKGLEIINELLERSRTRHLPPTYFTWIYFALEDYDKGYMWLDRALSEQDHWLTEIRNSHFYDNIRTDKRYNEILESMGFFD